MHGQRSQACHVTAISQTVIRPKLFVWRDNVGYEVPVCILVVDNTCKFVSMGLALVNYFKTFININF
jgi:hypothetical protein